MNDKSVLNLTGRQVKVLKSMRWRAKKDSDFRMLTRCQVVLMLNRGLSFSMVADIVGVHENSVRGWARKVQELGVAGLESKPYPGARPKLGFEEKEELKKIVSEPPTKAGLDTGVWSGPLVRKIIWKRFGVKYDVSQVRRILNQLGFSLQYPRVRLSKADSEKQKEWLDKTLPEIKKSPQGEECFNV